MGIDDSTLSAKTFDVVEAQELFLMGQTSDGRYRLGVGAAEALLRDAKRLAEKDSEELARVRSVLAEAGFGDAASFARPSLACRALAGTLAERMKELAALRAKSR